MNGIIIEVNGMTEVIEHNLHDRLHMMSLVLRLGRDSVMLLTNNSQSVRAIIRSIAAEAENLGDALRITHRRVKIEGGTVYEYVMTPRSLEMRSLEVE